MKGWMDARGAAALVKDGMTIMIGGFLGCGAPHRLIDALLLSGARDLTLICNDGGMARSPLGEPLYSVAKLIHAGQIKKLVATHVGMNPEVFERSHAGTMALAFLPQGSMSEMLRAGGAGLGGVLTRAGLGTVVEGFEHARGVVNVDGQDFLLMAPLRADVALIYGDTVDEAGNIWYKGAESNMNPMMATAAETVICEAGRRVPLLSIRPEDVRTGGIFIDYAVEGGE
jgi:acetate CoA/acetoacetate CoA-transferase alpha subunit